MDLDCDHYDRENPNHSHAADQVLSLLKQREGCSLSELNAGDLTVLLSAVGLLWAEKRIRTERPSDPTQTFNDQPYRVKGWLDIVRFFSNV